MIRFERATVDMARREVTLDGAPQHLEPQAFDVLAHLVANRDRVVPKSELLDDVWGDQFVSESALTTRIKEVRRAVGDDGARQGIVRNYRGRGYRFVADVDEVEPRDVIDAAVADDASPGTKVIGREAEVANVMALLDSSRVVTLIGPGGVGKTTLAGEVARRVERGCRTPSVVISLASIGEPSEVVHELRRATELSDAGPDETDLTAAVASLDRLLVFDNCEHVIDEAARLINSITSHEGPARVLTTSRERLGIPSEQVVPLRPLDPGSARELLVERARSLEPGWMPDDDQLVEQLVELVDRLPLAIEMAATRLPSIGLADLVDLLGQRLDLLRSSDRSADARHRTLTAVIEWSEQLLDRDAGRLLVDLSVFADSVGAADIAAVVGADAAELLTGPLSALVEHSLLVADTSHRPTRYHLLETVRACVGQRRDPTVDRRHAHHIADVLRGTDRMLRTPDESLAVDRLESLLGEIRGAHRWARASEVSLAGDMTASLLQYAQERSWVEPAAWSEELLTLVDVDQAGPAAASVAADAANRGDFDRALDLAASATSDGNPLVAAYAHDTCSNVGLYTGDLELSRHHSAIVLEHGERTANPMFWCLGIAGQVLSALYAGQRDRAGDLLAAATPPAPLNPTSSAWIAYVKGEVAAAEGNAVTAIERFDEAIALATPVRAHFVIGVARVSALAARTRAGDFDDAVETIVPVLESYRRARSLTHGVTALRNLIGLLVRQGRDESAMVLVGALSDPLVKNTYGAESELVDESVETVRSRHPVDVVEAWIVNGRSYDAVWALDYAIEVLTGADGTDEEPS